MSRRNRLFVVVCMLGLAAGPRVLAATDAITDAIEREDFATAEALLRAELGEAPDDESLRFELARVLAWAGNYTAALAEYDALATARPGNVDYALGRAQTYGWAGRDAAALAEIERARGLAPDYEAVWQLQFSLLRRGGSALRERLDALRPEAAMRFPESDWWREQPLAEPIAARTELSVTGEHQSLSTNVDDWNSLAARVTRLRSSGESYYGAVQVDERFGGSDTVLAGGFSLAATPEWTTGVDLALGPDAEFLPETALAGWASRPLANAWETTLRLRYRSYSSAVVTSAAGTAARYFGNFRAAYTLDFARLRGEETSLARIAALSYYHSDRVQLDLTLASGEEAEAIAPGNVLRTDVSAVTIGTRLRISERWQINAWLGTQRQGDLYRRKFLGVSLATGL